MTSKARRIVLIAALGVTAIALPAVGQQVREKTIQANPYRDIGGSCVYGRNGELLSAPKGAHCANREDDTPGASIGATGERFGGLPPALRTEANALVDSHVHVADHLIELRLAVVNDDKARTLELSDEVAKELASHLAREQALLDKLAAGHPAH